MGCNERLGNSVCRCYRGENGCKLPAGDVYKYYQYQKIGCGQHPSCLIHVHRVVVHRYYRESLDEYLELMNKIRKNENVNDYEVINLQIE